MTFTDIVGVGVAPSQGLRKGMVVNIDDAANQTTAQPANPSGAAMAR